MIFELKKTERMMRAPVHIVMHRLLIMFLAIVPGAAGLGQTVSLKVIETTDVHGAVFPYDFINDKPASGSLAQVHTYVQQAKSEGHEVVLLDAGDILQGQPVVYYYNFEQTAGRHLYALVMNYMGYDAATVGNHDIEPGHAVYDKFLQELDFPWMAANAVRTKGTGTYFPPYTVIEKAGLSIAVLGMVTPGIPNWLPQQIWHGMTFEDMVETAREWVAIIRQNENPDLLLGLFHSGVDHNFGGQKRETPRNENASQLVAEQVPGFDVVFVGHDHHGWNFEVTGPNGRPVHILGASSHARDVAVATIHLQYNKDKKLWQKEIVGEQVSMAGVTPDPNFLSRFQSAFEEVKTYVSQPIGTFTKTVTTRDAMFGDAAFVDIVHRIQLDLTGADISISAPLSQDASIEKGPVYVRDMFNLYKFENLLYTMELSGREILGFLEYSYGNWFNHMQGPADHLLNFRTDEKGEPVWSQSWGSYQLAGPSFNFDSMAGILYAVDVSRPAGERIRMESMADGTPFKMDERYKVAINSYRGNGGGGHLTVGAGIAKEDLPGRIVAATDKDLRYYLMKWIESTKTITPEPLGNWQVVPDTWWQAGKKRDYDLLYEAAANHITH